MTFTSTQLISRRDTCGTLLEFRREGGKKTGGEAYFSIYSDSDILSPKTDCQTVCIVKVLSKGSSFSDVRSLKWVTHYIHCNITVNIHKLIII